MTLHDSKKPTDKLFLDTRYKIRKESFVIPYLPKKKLKISPLA